MEEKKEEKVQNVEKVQKVEPVVSNPSIQSTTTTTTTTTGEKKSTTLRTCLIVVGVLLILCIVCLVVTLGGSALIGKNLVDQVNQEIQNLPEESKNKILDDISKGSGNSGDNDNTVVGGDLPSNFPTDVPLMAGYQIRSSSTNDGKVTVLYSIKTDADTVDRFYKENLPTKGWVKKGEMTLFGKVLTFSKNNKELAIVILGPSTAEDTTSLVTLTVEL